MTTRIEKMDAALKNEGLSDKEIVAVHELLEKMFPTGVYKAAVIFLGWVTVLLAVGAIALIAYTGQSPEALWVALGAGIGGLAGIFAQKD